MSYDFIFDTFSLLADRENRGIKSKKIVFILFDAGETKAMEPVIDELHRARIEFQVIAFGTAWTLLKEHPFTINIHEVFKVSAESNQKEWERMRPLDQRILKQIEATIRADIVITGMVSRLQKEIAEILKAKGADIIAYYDSFAPDENSGLITSFLRLASRVLVPSQQIATSILKLDPEAKIDVVGQPILEQWLEKSQRVDHSEIRNVLQIDDRKPLLIYVSGYGEDYAESFSAFAKAIQYIDHFHIGISLHPKMDGVLERQILAANDCPHIFFIPQQVETFSAVAVSDLVVTWRSTVGVQAAFLGKPVIYLDCKGSNYSSLAIEKGWAVQLFDAGEFLRLLIEFEIETVLASERFSEGGVPRQSTELILRRIVRSKERAFRPRKPLDPTLIRLFQQTISKSEN